MSKRLFLNQNMLKHNGQGKVLYKLGKFEQAIESYTQAIKHKQNYIEAYYNLGNCLQTKGNLEQALEIYIKIIKMDS